MHLVQRRTCWLPTWQGWLLLIVLAVILCFGLLKNIYSFLAVNHPVRSEILVIEGWLPDYALEKGIIEFKQHGYKTMLTTGGPLLEGYSLAGYHNYADLSRATLLRLGIDSAQVVSVPSPLVKKDRTYASALEVKKWLARSGNGVQRIDIYSLGPHARRTRLIYGKAFGRDVSIGIISAEDFRYDTQAWWDSSGGVRTILDEAIAYIYARLLFKPE